MNRERLIKDPKEIEDIFKKAIKARNKELADGLSIYVKDPKLIFEYVNKIVKRKVSDALEDVLAENEVTAFYYTTIFLKTFPQRRRRNCKNVSFCYSYATEILHDRFIKGESLFAKNEVFFKEYLNFLKRINKLNEFLKDHPEIKL
jgi:hypothetical protein